MIEALKSDVVVAKVGGRFKLAVLMQKRMVDVAFGAPLLVDGKGKTLMEAVVQEILDEKISLDASGGLTELAVEEPPPKKVSRSKAEKKETSDE